MIAHSTSRRSARALPQIESTIAVTNTTAKIIKCKANKAFTVGNASIKAGETFYLVRSESREGRYYIVHFSDIRRAYQCSCGANCCEHQHLKTVREYVMTHNVLPSNPNAAPMTTPKTSAEVRKVKAEQSNELPEFKPLTKEDWKLIMKRDKERQAAMRAEERRKLEIAKEKDRQATMEMATC
jgi:hypothetical protein